MLKKKKGQVTVEYFILFAAIIALMLVFLPGAFTTSMNDSLTSASDAVSEMGGRLIPPDSIP